MASRTPFFISYVVKTGAGTYTPNGPYGSGYTVTETDDGGGDDPTRLGDIGNDDFSANLNNSGANFATNFQFIANTADGTGFIAVATNGGYGSGPYYYLFQTVNNYPGGSTVTTGPGTFAICFTTGTRIETSRGQVAIEDLAVGDTAVTASGGLRPIQWIGKRTLDCVGDAAHMAPVRVRANAFGAGVPERDVCLSPGHPVLVRQDGREVLVPIMNLINGTSIERSAMTRVTYWHIELDQHDVLIADGLPAESFFDMGSRGWFDNDLDDVLPNPDLVPAGQHGRCRDVIIEGPMVEAERKRVADLFYADLSAQCAWPTHESYAAR